MEKNFKCISTFKISEFNTYTFVICKELKKNIEYITKLLNLDKVPKKLFDDYNRDKVVLIGTGSQGERNSALSKIANNFCDKANLESFVCF